MSVMEELLEIFRDIFDDETLELRDSTNAEDIEDWDSLAQINLIVAIEKSFKIKFMLGELDNLKNVGEMITLIEKKRSKQT